MGAVRSEKTSAEARAKDVLAEANRQAKAQAEKILADANAIAEGHVSKARAVHAEAAAVSQATETAKARLDALRAEAAAQEQKLQAAREAVRKMLG